MSTQPSSGELVAIIGAVVAAFAVVGRGIAWLLGFSSTRADSRATKLDKWQSELVAREDKIDAKLEQRLASLEADAAQAKDQANALRISFELVASALRAIDPFNTALSRAEQLLQKSFPLVPVIPADMTADLGRIEARGQADAAKNRRTEATQ